MIVSRSDLKFYISQDEKMNNKNNHSFREKIRVVVAPDLIQKYLYFLRKAEFHNNRHNKIIGAYYKYRLRKLGIRLGYSIPINVCGPGLSLPHHGTIIVNSNAKIGANCRLHACVNIGASGGSGKAPQLGDNVYIGPSAVLFGDIKIANNVTIGANATVNKSCIIENVVLAGSPASIVKESYPNWVEFNRISK